MKTSQEILRSFLNSISPVGDEIFTKLADFLTEKKISKNGYLVKAGDLTSEIFFVVDGLVRLYYETKEGDQRTKSFYSEKSVIASYRSLLTQTSSNLSIQCLEDTVVLVGNYSKIRALNDGDLNLQICARKIAEYEFVEKDLREFQFLTLSAKERYNAFLERYPDISGRVSSIHIASYLGIRPETLSRIKTEGLQKQ